MRNRSPARSAPALAEARSTSSSSGGRSSGVGGRIDRRSGRRRRRHPVAEVGGVDDLAVDGHGDAGGEVTAADQPVGQRLVERRPRLAAAAARRRGRGRRPARASRRRRRRRVASSAPSVATVRWRRRSVRRRASVVVGGPPGRSWSSSTGPAAGGHRRRPLGRAGAERARGRPRSPRSAGPSEAPHHDAGWPPRSGGHPRRHRVSRAAAAPSSAPARTGRRCSSTRSSTSPASKRSSTSPPAHASTSSHDTGVDTVGSGPGPQRVRRDRRLVVGVLAPVDEDLPRPHRLGHHRRDLLRAAASRAPGRRRGRSRRPRSWVTPAVFSGTYSCSPFEPDVLHHPSSSTAARTSRTRSGDARSSRVMSVRGPGSKSNTTARGVSRSAASAIGACSSMAAMFAGPHQRRRAPRCSSTRCRRWRSPGPERHRHPLRPVVRAALLEEALAVGAVGEAAERQRPAPQVGQTTGAMRAW